MTTKGGSTPFDMDSWIEQLKRCEHIKEAEVKALCTRAKEILLEESNVQTVESPVTVSNSGWSAGRHMNASGFEMSNLCSLCLCRSAETFTASSRT